MSTGNRVKSSIPKGRCHGDKGLTQGHGVEVSIELNSERRRRRATGARVMWSRDRKRLRTEMDS